MGTERISGPISNIRTKTSEISLRVQGFTGRQIGRLALLRISVESGEVNDETPESKRLMFVRWLVEHGKIGEGVDQSLYKGYKKREWYTNIDQLSVASSGQEHPGQSADDGISVPVSDSAIATIDRNEGGLEEAIPEVFPCLKSLRKGCLETIAKIRKVPANQSSPEFSFMTDVKDLSRDPYYQRKIELLINGAEGLRFAVFLNTTDNSMHTPIYTFELRAYKKAFEVIEKRVDTTSGENSFSKNVIRYDASELNSKQCLLVNKAGEYLQEYLEAR